MSPIPVDVGALVDAQGIQGSVCKQTPSKIARHQAINDVIARAITAAGVPITKEPVSLVRIDGKWPDGLRLIPWQGGKPLTWDVMVVTCIPCPTLPAVLLKVA